jgi:hypothetical protein
MLASDDGLWVDPLTLQPGDRFVQIHRFSVSDGASDGPYALDLGLYDPKTNERWAILGHTNSRLGSGELNESPEVCRRRDSALFSAEARRGPAPNGSRNLCPAPAGSQSRRHGRSVVPLEQLIRVRRRYEDA